MGGIAMKSERPLFSKDRSRCCGYPARLVKSRDGGFVSQNCTKCGKSNWVNKSQLPDLKCPRCDLQMKIETEDSRGRKSFSYLCPKCGQRQVLSEMLPIWSELFRYSGLAAYGDFPEP
jgi:predicted RNA-binding Zn-ribbon protein involved in translation (DUF1610 family)